MNQSYQKREYSVEKYNPLWKKTFLKEAETLQSIFGTLALDIQHIGSTAVPGLAGKPTIDILICVNDIKPVESLNDQMEAAGYKPLGEYVQKDALLFVREKNHTRLMNVHVFQKDAPHVKEMLDLRNYFISHPKIVKEYSELKTNLYQKYPRDYAKYRQYKDAWMEKLKKKILNRGGELLTTSQ